MKTFLYLVIHRLLNGLRWLVRPNLIQAGPLAIALLAVAYAGLTTTLFGTISGLDTQGRAEQMADQLQAAPAQFHQQITDLYKAGKIDAYTYRAEEERINALESVFDLYAHNLRQIGRDAGDKALVQGIGESLLALSPFEGAGKLIQARKGAGFAVIGGQVIDAVIGAWSTGTGTTGFFQRLRRDPLAGIQANLDNEVTAILGQDTDGFFKARMRQKINFLKNTWQDLSQQYADNPLKAQQEYQSFLKDRAKTWGQGMNLLGEGQKWFNAEAFAEWLNQQAMNAVAAEQADATPVPVATNTPEPTATPSPTPEPETESAIIDADTQFDTGKWFPEDQRFALCQQIEATLPDYVAEDLGVRNVIQCHFIGPDDTPDFPYDNPQVYFQMRLYYSDNKALEAWNDGDYVTYLLSGDTPDLNQNPIVQIESFTETDDEGNPYPVYTTKTVWRFKNTIININEAYMLTADRGLTQRVINQLTVLINAKRLTTVLQ